MYHDNAGAIRLLSSCGADVDLPDRNGVTPLGIALEQGRVGSLCACLTTASSDGQTQHPSGGVVVSRRAYRVVPSKMLK